MKKTIFRRISVLLCLLFLLGAGIYGGRYVGQQYGNVSENINSTESYCEEFDDYMNQIFCREVAANTINMHYTLKNPKNYGIDEYVASYGDLGKESHQKAVASLENMKASLQKFPVKELDTSRQMTCDILLEEAETELSGAQFYLYQEMLRPSTGIQSELPVLMAEYTFYNEKDVQDYLALLQQTPGYFQKILLFEMEKANNGLFMAEFAAEDIISQCRNFIENPAENYLISTFADKIDEMEELSEHQKQTYKQQNEEAVQKAVIPAYETMIQGLEKLKKSGQNQQGLCYLPKGVDYYKYLVKSYTGSDMDIPQMQQAAEQQRAEDLTEAAKLLSESPNLLVQASSYAFEQQDPTMILQELQMKMQKDFPVPPDTNFTIKYVHPSLEEAMAPAFYLAVPIDDISQNSIYINGSSNYQKMKLYTTLAHEGFPGHLYQNIMERSQEFLPVRSLLGTSGYTEGWATYVEMISYGYADIDPQLAILLQKDQSALLSLYATADMGIHYDGWSLEQMMDFFGEYQITEEETLTEIYHLIVEEPAHYLKYYIGYLEFLKLKEYAEHLFGEQYSDYKFHEALMKMGPAQFSVLEKYLPEYYDSVP